MVEFYLTFLGAKATHVHTLITFMTYDYEHHRLAIASEEGLKSRDEQSVGLAHIAFGFSQLADLARSYEEKKKKGILPFWVINHGISTSMYYKDPDGNQIELQVDNFDTADEATMYMAGPKFEENPIGIEYDPEELVKHVANGLDSKAILEEMF